MKRLLTILLIIQTFVTFTLSANNSNAYRHYSVNNGLSENCVRSIVQDSVGYMWFATKNGLNRYNGVHFTVFGSSENGSTDPYVNINSLALHSNKQDIWVGAHELFLFDSKSEQLVPFQKKSVSGETVVSPFNMCYDRKGVLWIATPRGLFLYDAKNNTMRSLHHDSEDPSSLPHNHVWVVFKDASNQMWVGTRGGLGRYNELEDNFTVYKHPTPSERWSDSEVISLLDGVDGHIWAGTWSGGLWDLDKATGETKVYFGHDDKGYISRIREMFQFDGRTLYLGSDDGLYIFDTEKRGEARVHEDFAEESVYECLRDKENGLWIGTYFSGVAYVSPKINDTQWYYDDGRVGSISGNAVSEICEDEQGNLWIATENGGLNYLDVKSGKFKNKRNDDFIGKSVYRNIHALLLDGDDLWIGTFSQGVVVLNTRSGAIRSYNYSQSDPNTLSDNHVYTLYKDSTGRIYAGTMFGLSYFDPRVGDFVRSRRISYEFVYDMIEDKHNYLWVVTKGKGIYRYSADRTEIEHYDFDCDANLRSGWFVDVYVDRKDNLWFCSEGAGVYRYDYQTGEFLNYSVEENIPCSVIYGALDDGMNNLWLTTNSGLIRYNINSKVARTYTRKDGFQSNQYNYRSAYAAKDGTFWVGGISGLSSFDPLSLTINSKRPRATISAVNIPIERQENVIIDRIPVNGERIIVPSGTMWFEVLFECLSYVVPEKNRYAYRIEELQEGWVYTDKPSVSICSLSPGDYTISVKVCNNDGFWSNGQATVKIRVMPTIWQTRVAKSIYLLLLLAVICFVWRSYTSRYKRRMESEALEKEHHRELETFQSKLTFFTQVVHEIKTPVTLIKAPLESVIEQGEWNETVESNLDVINKNTDRLLTLTHELLDFRKVEMDGYRLDVAQCDVKMLLSNIVDRFKYSPKRGLSIGFECDAVPACEAMVDAEAITKIVSNLLFNAMRYTNSFIVVSLGVVEVGQQPHLRIAVRDDGSGISKEDAVKVFTPFFQVKGRESSGVGVGLSLVNVLVMKSGGQVYVNSEYVGGCEMVVEIPYVESGSSVQLPSEPSLQRHDSGDKQAEIEAVLSSQQKVLLVEDETDMRYFLACNLEGKYKVLVAGDGVEAMELLESNHADLIISDIMMPRMDGFELLQAVRGDQILCHTPFILLSAIDSVESKIKGMERGADAYIEKPFSMHHIKATIDAIFEARNRILQHYKYTPTEKELPGLGRADAQWLSKVEEVVNENMTNPKFSIDLLCDSLAISRSNLQRKMNSLVGMPPNDYIRLIRLKKAADLLKEGNYRVNEICFMVGFNTHSYFARCFQKQFGVLPKDYVKE